MLVDGGDMKPGPATGQKLGPLGINIGQVIQEINKATSGFKGMKVPVEIDINTKTKKFSVQVFSPSTAELIKKELEIEKGSGEMKKIKVGNLAIEQVISIAKIKYPGMTASSFKAAVKSVAGSCASLGVLIESKEALDIEGEINKGTYDKEIEAQKTDVSQEKRQKLDSFFKKLESEQEEILRKEEEAKKAAEEIAKVPAEGEKPAEEEEEGEKEEEEKK